MKVLAADESFVSFALQWFDFFCCFVLLCPTCRPPSKFDTHVRFLPISCVFNPLFCCSRARNMSQLWNVFGGALLQLFPPEKFVLLLLLLFLLFATFWPSHKWVGVSDYRCRVRACYVTELYAKEGVRVRKAGKRATVSLERLQTTSESSPEVFSDLGNSRSIIKMRLHENQCRPATNLDPENTSKTSIPRHSA